MHHALPVARLARVFSVGVGRVPVARKHGEESQVGFGNGASAAAERLVSLQIFEVVAWHSRLRLRQGEALQRHVAQFHTLDLHAVGALRYGKLVDQPNAHGYFERGKSGTYSFEDC